MRSTSPDIPRDGPAIEVAGLRIEYPTTFEKKASIKTFVSDRGRQKWKRRRTVEAIRDVTFSLDQGKVLCIIGRNGAGKSTMLRVLAGILAPTGGRVVIRGDVATLLSLGAAFNKNLTGRENIFLGAMAAGFSRAEVNERMDAIEAFAELGEFIDAPARVYSSGMYARLGFSVAIHVDADVLLIDEALGAGDAAFRDKCTAKIHELCQAQHRTVVMVTHQTDIVSELAHEVLWMDKGQVKEKGDAEDVLIDYRRFLFEERRAEAAGGVVS